MGDFTTNLQAHSGDVAQIEYGKRPAMPSQVDAFSKGRQRADRQQPLGKPDAAVGAGAQNWLFERSKVAGQRAPAIVKLVRPAKLNGHEPWVDLKGMLARLTMYLNSRHRRAAAASLAGAELRPPNRRSTLGAMLSMWGD